MYRLLLCGLVFIIMAGCNVNDRASKIDWQGHRGARGVYPENTLPAFRHALEVGMNTFELDVVITADSQVVVSHEPFMSHQICLTPAGGEIPEAIEQKFNIFQMTYSEVAMFDCGSRPHPRFTEQNKLSATKPLLSQVFELARQFSENSRLPLVNFNIEIKSRPEWDGEFHPMPVTYVNLVLREIKDAGVLENVTIQSFDYRPLQILHEQNYPVKLAFLTKDEQAISTHIKKLGFQPDIYSPYYPLVSEKLVEFCHSKGIKVIPWTVNTPEIARRLLELGVDGVITDYPSIRDELVSGI